VERIEVLRHGQVRQARLYYLRGKVGKEARIKERRDATATNSRGEAARTRGGRSRAAAAEAEQ
jgi:large subunit ribosomal protein L19